MHPYVDNLLKKYYASIGSNKPSITDMLCCINQVSFICETQFFTYDIYQLLLQTIANCNFYYNDPRAQLINSAMAQLDQKINIAIYHNLIHTQNQLVAAQQQLLNMQQYFYNLPFYATPMNIAPNISQPSMDPENVSDASEAALLIKAADSSESMAAPSIENIDTLLDINTTVKTENIQNTTSLNDGFIVVAYNNKRNTKKNKTKTPSIKPHNKANEVIEVETGTAKVVVAAKVEVVACSNSYAPTASSIIPPHKTKTIPKEIWDSWMDNLLEKSSANTKKTLGQLKRLVADGVDINSTDQHKMKLLDYAIAQSRHDLVKYLCDKLAAVVDEKMLLNALQQEVATDDLNMIKYLSSKLSGAQVRSIIKKDLKNLLINAVKSKNLGRLEFILQQCEDCSVVLYPRDTNIIDSTILMTLKHITWQDACEIIEVILKNVNTDIRKKLVTNISDQGQNCLGLVLICSSNALKSSARASSIICIKLLDILIENGADINNVNAKKRHILQMAVEKSDYEIIKYLLESMCEEDIDKYIHHRDCDDRTAFMIACNRGVMEIMDLIEPHTNKKLNKIYGTQLTIA